MPAWTPWTPRIRRSDRAGRAADHRAGGHHAGGAPAGGDRQAAGLRVGLPRQDPRTRRRAGLVRYPGHRRGRRGRHAPARRQRPDRRPGALALAPRPPGRGRGRCRHPRRLPDQAGRQRGRGDLDRARTTCHRPAAHRPVDGREPPQPGGGGAPTSERGRSRPRHSTPMTRSISSSPTCSGSTASGCSTSRSSSASACSKRSSRATSSSAPGCTSGRRSRPGSARGGPRASWASPTRTPTRATTPARRPGTGPPAPMPRR